MDWGGIRRTSTQFTIPTGNWPVGAVAEIFEEEMKPGENWERFT
jgi:hypothetical protein